jgi:hypothetical protein
VRTAHQPDESQPLNLSSDALQYLGALKECHEALIETLDVTDEIIKLVKDFLEGDAIDSQDVLLLCERYEVMSASTRQNFEISKSPLDKTTL